SGATYPAAWRISIPKLELAIQGQPLMPNQELDLSTVYWEGAVQFTGTHQEQPTEAKGYVELTGYKESLTALN
ncbi:MAG: lipocalin family protein, partial [Cyanobacteria bacterium P01_F01_bin.42]